MRALLVLLIVVVGRHAFAAPTLASSPSRLLGVRINLPDGMKVVPNERDRDNVTLPSDVAMRAQLTLSEGAVHVVARHTFMRLTGDFRRAVIAELALQDLVGVTRSIELLDGTKAVAFDPPTPRRGDRSEVFHALYIVDDDRRVTSISFYASGSAWDDIDTWVKLAQQSTESAHLFGWSLATYWSVVWIPIAGISIELTPPAGWAAVPIRNAGVHAGMAYQGGSLGTPSAVCGIDDRRAGAPTGAVATQLKFLGTVGTARSWKDGTTVHAELATSRGVRAWCHVRGGRPDDALRALRTLAAATVP